MNREAADTVTRENTAAISPRGLFKTFALAEMFTWAGLITAIVLRTLDVTNIVPIAGGLHGFVFLSYCATTIFVWVNQKWSTRLGLAGLFLAIVPFATVPFDLWVDRRGLLGGPWRLAPGGDAPQGFIEHLQAWILRHVVLSIVLLVLAVTALFLLLLWLGPPIPRG